MMLKQQDLSKMMEVATEAARLAGTHAMNALTDTKVSIKRGTELVTEADAQCQQLIIDKIKETYPDHGFIAEEGTNGRIFKQPPRGDAQVWWAIDPIDGTNNFAHKILLFTVSVAAMFDGRPVAGTIFAPATDSMFAAFDKGQAQLNGERITASEEKINRFASVGIDSHLQDGVAERFREIMLRTKFRNLGSTALQFAYVANGGFIASLSPCPKLWDIAAAAVLCESAGAIVSKWNGEKIFPIDLQSYNGEELEALAANKTVHKEILKLISDV